MFKKSLAHQSNATPLRSSARRQLLASAVQQHPAILEGVPEGEGKVVKNTLMPDGLRSVGFETSGGVEGTMYMSPDGEPLWMSFGRGSKELIPTLSLLAQSLPTPPLPVLQIHHPLPPPLFSGAPLFLPAVRHMSTPWRLPDVGEGEVVALVADTKGDGNVSYAGVARVVAKGGLGEALERLIKHRQEGVDREEGKFADMLCIIDDHLWDMGSKPTLNSFPLPSPRKPLMPPPESEAPAVPAEAEATPDADGATDDIASLSVSENAAPAANAPPLTPSEISTLLSAALLQTLSSISPTLLPLPSSQLYSGYILPNRPAYIPAARREDVVIGKSEWKKLAKWMKEIGKEGLVKVKETKGEVVVTGFDPKHPLIQAHAPFLTVAEEETKAAKRAAREAAAAEAATPASAGGKGGREIAIEELWKPSGSAVGFWEACGVEERSLNSSSSFKPLLDDYVLKHKLEDPNDRRIVTLDDTLSTAVGLRKDKAGARLQRDEILRRLRAGVAWSVSIGGVVKKGNMTPITIAIRTRQGRKTVTLVSGLEAFGIDPDEFSEEMRRVCAGSSSVAPLTGASPKLNLKEVLVQGTQTKAVMEGLAARGVPRRWIKEDVGGKKK